VEPSDLTAGGYTECFNPESGLQDGDLPSSGSPSAIRSLKRHVPAF
jgi:hypothetical protein